MKYGRTYNFSAGPAMMPEEVLEEVRRMKRIFGSEKGGLLLAMGNGILSGTPLENIRAALDEMYAE